MHFNYSSNNTRVVRVFVCTFQRLRERTELRTAPRLPSFVAHLSLCASDLTSLSRLAPNLGTAFLKQSVLES